mmetsp:Transcript_5737/g.9919  ORF Transcript_5737/g.9919 Transcript_5737/m.9919 type:complete len:150 (+) Transcript_5737:366-815(+)
MPRLPDPTEGFPSIWRDTPRNRERWAQMKRNEAYLRAHQRRYGTLTCNYCRKQRLRLHHWAEPSSDDDATVDHFVPICRGGTDEERNLVVACRRCNEDKGNSLINATYADGCALNKMDTATGQGDLPGPLQVLFILVIFVCLYKCICIY